MLLIFQIISLFLPRLYGTLLSNSEFDWNCNDVVRMVENANDYALRNYNFPRYNYGNGDCNASLTFVEGLVTTIICQNIDIYATCGENHAWTKYFEITMNDNASTICVLNRHVMKILTA